jgi:hypothetical protein
MTDLTIRPFEVHVPEEDLAGLQQRIAATRWPPEELVADRSQGVQLATIQHLVTYWSTGYDWRARRGRVRPGHPVAARLWLLLRAGRDRLGPRPHRARLGGADAPARLHPLRRPGR